MADHSTPKPPAPNARLPIPDPANPEDFLMLLFETKKSFANQIAVNQKQAQSTDRLERRDAFYKLSKLKCDLEALTNKDRIAPLTALPEEKQQKRFLGLLGELDKQHQAVENSLKKLSQDKEVKIPVGGCSTEPPREPELPQSTPPPELRKASAGKQPGSRFDSTTAAGRVKAILEGATTGNGPQDVNKL